METLTTPPLETQTGEGSTETGQPPGDREPDFRRLAEQLAARHSAAGQPGATAPQPGKRPRGRPRKDGRPAGSVPRDPPAAALAEPEAAEPAKPAYVVDPDFIRYLATTGLKGLEAWEQTQIFLRAHALYGDEAAAKALALKVGAPPGGIEVISACLAEIAQKYALISQFTPEIALAITALSWLFKDLTIFANQARQEAAAQRRAPAETAAAPAAEQ